MPATSQTANTQDLAASAQLGFELGVLIAGLKVSEEVKEALVVLLQAAKPNQLVELNEALRHALLMQATKEADEVYEKRLRQLVKDFEAKQEEIDKETGQQLAKLATEVESHAGGILI